MSIQHAKQQFEQAAEELLQNKSLEELTTKEIVKKSGLTRQSFYNYYYDKFDLVNQIFVSDAQKSILLLLDKTVLWDDVILNSLETMQNKQHFYANVLKYQGQNSLTDFFAKYIVNVHTHLVGADILKKADHDRAVGLLQFHAYGTAHMTTNWAISGMKNQPEELAGLIYECMPDLIKASYQQLGALHVNQLFF